MPLDDVARAKVEFGSEDYFHDRSFTPIGLEEALATIRGFENKRAYHVGPGADGCYVFGIVNTARLFSVTPEVYDAVVSLPEGRAVTKGGTVRISYLLKTANALRSQYQPS